MNPNDSTSSVADLHQLTQSEWQSHDNHVECQGSAHECASVIYVTGLDKRFELTLKGVAEATVVGHHLGPRVVLWTKSELKGHHPELGNVRLTIVPEKIHAGTIVPLEAHQEFPAVNRNTYLFRFEVDNVGELISDRPAIVEGIIDGIPPKATYEFMNGPINFYLRSDSSKATFAVLESAETITEPGLGRLGAQS